MNKKLIFIIGCIALFSVSSNIIMSSDVNKNTSPEVAVNNYSMIQLKSYSVSYNETQRYFNISGIFYNSGNWESNVSLMIFVNPPLICEYADNLTLGPYSSIMRSFIIYTTAENVENSNALLSIFFEYNDDLYERTYEIQLTTNSSENAVMLRFDGGWRNLALGAGLFCVAAIYAINTYITAQRAKSDSDHKNIDEIIKIKKQNRQMNSNLFSITSALIAYYMLSEYYTPPEGIFAFWGGYEVLALMVASGLYCLFKIIFANEKEVFLKYSIFISMILVGIMGIWDSNSLKTPMTITWSIGIFLIIISIAMQNFPMIQKHFRSKREFINHSEDL